MGPYVGVIPVGFHHPAPLVQVIVALVNASDRCATSRVGKRLLPSALSCVQVAVAPLVSRVQVTVALSPFVCASDCRSTVALVCASDCCCTGVVCAIIIPIGASD